MQFLVEERPSPDPAISNDPSLDRRPRIVLLIGDGFSRSLVMQRGMMKQIVTNPMLPPPSSAIYLPSTDDMFTEGPLWDPTKFPLVMPGYMRHLANYADAKSAAEEFFLSMSNAQAVHGKRGSGFIDWTAGGPVLELRALLWHLFKYYDRVLWNGMTESIMRSWVWPQQLAALVQRARLTVISYNYDLTIEKTLTVCGMTNLVAPAADCVWHYVNRDPNFVVVLKPHGSLSHSAGGRLFYSPNMWLQQAVIKGSTPFGSMEVSPNLTDCPAIPDLVPPGHAGDHLANKVTDVDEATEIAIRDADLLVVCGLAAFKPDTEEIERYIRVLNRRRPAIHIGLRNKFANDELNPMGCMLRRFASSYSFLPSEEVHFWGTPLAVSSGRDQDLTRKLHR